MKSRRTIVLGALLMALAVLVLASGCGTPALQSEMSYQGWLTDAAGNPINGTRNMTFRLYTIDTGGTSIWEEAHSGVQVTDGLFNVVLGGTTALDEANFHQPLYLEVEVGGETLLPRQKLLAAAYAFSLVPGAVIKGYIAATETYSSTLNVANLLAVGGGQAIGATSSSGTAIAGLGGSECGNHGVYGKTEGDWCWSSGVFGEAAQDHAAGVTGKNTAGGQGVYGWGNTGPGVYGRSDSGDGVAGYSNAAGNSGVYGYNETAYGVFGRTNNVDGYGVFGQNNTTTGVGTAGFMSGYSPGDQPATWWKPAGLFGGRNGIVAFTKDSVGVGVVGHCTATSGSGCRGIHARTDSTTGWAGKFDGSGNGVYISVPAGKTGLEVASGTKSAVVGTADGSRLLYTEEATEVWFADYGFGRLQDGLAVVPIDPIFAQTVNLEEPYHVFVQAYGNAEVYVTNRTPTQFEVRVRDGDWNVEFSYRLVAWRLGYEGQRMERAPEADSDPNLYPEKRAELEAQEALSNGWVSP